VILEHGYSGDTRTGTWVVLQQGYSGDSRAGVATFDV
jgi:hypothetical protein